MLGVSAVILGSCWNTVFATVSEAAPQIGRPWLQISVGLLSVASAVLGALQTFLRYSELAEKHRVAGTHYANLRHRIELLAAMPLEHKDKLREALANIEQRWAKQREEIQTSQDRFGIASSRL